MKGEICQAAGYTTKRKYDSTHQAHNARGETGLSGIPHTGRKFHGLKEIMWRWNLKVDNLLKLDMAVGR